MFDNNSTKIGRGEKEAYDFKVLPTHEVVTILEGRWISQGEDFWFLVRQVKSLEVVTPMLTTRKQLNKLKSMTVLRSIRGLTSQGKTLP